jgi:hypothetical protein
MARIYLFPPRQVWPLRDDLLHSFEALSARAARCPPLEIDLNQLPPIPPRLAPGHYTNARSYPTLGDCTCAACQPTHENDRAP